MNTLLRLAIIAHFALVLPSARADEKNGLNVTVSKSVLETKNVRGGWTSSRGTFDAVERTQALKITAKNISFTPMPEGDLEWRIVVVSDKTSVLSSGNEKIKPLKPANTQEFEVGSVTVANWRSYNSKGQDRLEWQVAVKQGEKEIIKMQSAPNFDALAKRAEEDMAKALREKSGK
ncbi:MAG: hypothetical protein K8R23_01155 [Chthoniobacter sp.]|nr:hypothetical protein [Chthoniobacter sp.]